MFSLTTLHRRKKRKATKLFKLLSHFSVQFFYLKINNLILTYLVFKMNAKRSVVNASEDNVKEKQFVKLLLTVQRNCAL